MIEMEVKRRADVPAVHTLASMTFNEAFFGPPSPMGSGRSSCLVSLFLEALFAGLPVPKLRSAISLESNFWLGLMTLDAFDHDSCIGRGLHTM